MDARQLDKVPCVWCSSMNAFVCDGTPGLRVLTFLLTWCVDRVVHPPCYRARENAHARLQALSHHYNQPRLQAPRNGGSGRGEKFLLYSSFRFFPSRWCILLNSYAPTHICKRHYSQLYEHLGDPDWMNVCQCLQFLNDFKGVAGVLMKLICGTEV